AVAPVTHPGLVARLDEVIEGLVSDNVQAWELGPDASWGRRPSAQGGRRGEIIELLVADSVQAWELGPDGSWQRRRSAKGARRVATHEVLPKRALERSAQEPRKIGSANH